MAELELLKDIEAVKNSVGEKADAVHSHDGTYSETNHNHDARYPVVGVATDFGTSTELKGSAGNVYIGMGNGSFAHYQTDATIGHWFNKDVNVRGEIFAGSGYNKKVYHQGNKPTPAEIGAMPAPVAQQAFGGNQNAITTAQFIEMLTSMGAFGKGYWVSRGTWSYASNQIISDSGYGNIHLAGSVVEVFSGSVAHYTIRITTPTTGSSGVNNFSQFIYVNNGSSYAPTWSKVWTSNNDGANSGLDADLLDGKHASSFMLAGTGGLGGSCVGITDWNNALKNGYYMGYGCANAPDSDWWMGYVLNHHDGWVVQVANNFNSTRAWKQRFKVNGTWTAWTDFGGGGGGVKSVQRGITTFSAGSGGATQYVTISAVNVSKSVVIVTNPLAKAGSTSWLGDCAVELYSSTQLRISGNDYASQRIAWQVVEYN